MVILWTDALIYFLVLTLSLLGYFLHAKEYMQRPLHKIRQNCIGMVSLLVLLFFIVIGLLDSVHFKPAESKNNEIISVLDAWTTVLRTQTEKTYSAPFALTLYGKEMLALPDGSKRWDYPRLQYGGRHLTDPEQRTGDILQKTLMAASVGVGIFALLFSLCNLPGLIASLKADHGLVASVKQLLPVTRVSRVLWLVMLLLCCKVSILMYLAQFYHVMGTDKVGEDVFYQAIKSIRTGLVLGTLTTLIMLPMAITFGILAGYFRGWVDDVIQYIYTLLNSIPSVLLIAASILMVQVYMAKHEAEYTSVLLRADLRLLFLCIILGVTSWTGLCRLLRAETLKLREMEYVQAAQALGVRQGTILLRHILPNVMHLVLISVVLDFSSLVLAEAVLSYINIGVDPTTYSWGNMINGARLEMARQPIVWWSLSAAFVFMFALVLAANLFADTVQDAFDPRRSQRES